MGVIYLRVGFRTTVQKELIDNLKIKAIQQNVNVNDILEKLIEKYLKGEIEITLKNENK